MTIIDEYFQLFEKCQKKYGEKSTIFIEIGKFYEVYGINNDEYKLGNIYEIADTLNIQITKKNKNISGNSFKNPLVAGIPNYTIEKHTQTLVNNGYTVVIYSQVKHGSSSNTFSGVERKITNVFSPGTKTEVNKVNNNFLSSIYIETFEVHNKKKMCIGISFIDITTGENIVYETASKEGDENYALDSVFHYLKIYQPSEIIITTNDEDITKDYLISYLEISDLCHYYSKINNEYLKINYQNKFLSKIFKKTGIITPIEYIDLETKKWGLISFIILLQFTYEHNEDTIKKIHKPKIIDEDNYLILTKDSCQQLNIIPTNTLKIFRNDSLISVINYTNTAMGKRLLQERILHPITNSDIIEERYNQIEELCTKNDNKYKYETFEPYLMKIVDLERLHRKLSLGKLQPADFNTLDMCYNNITSIIELLSNNEKLKNILPDEKYITLFKEYIQDYNSQFNINEIEKYHINNINNSFFIKGVNDEIDSIQENIDNIDNFFYEFAHKLSNMIENGCNFVKKEYSEKDGHFFLITSNRSKLLKNQFIVNKIDTIIIETSKKKYTIKKNEIEFKKHNNTSNVRITLPLITELSDEVILLRSKISSVVQEAYLKKLSDFDIKYSETLDVITKFIAHIDVIKSGAKSAIKNVYCKPVINKEMKDSYFEAKNIRHPIIEKINVNEKYVPNDIKLGDKELKGMLLYGTNACGKSSLMKAVGLNIVMAQAGFFVPCSSFTYKPYKYIFTRINNNDNIFKNQSSFAVEVSELKSIFKRCNSESIIIGDELCSGTESISALSIVAAGITKLSQDNTSFIFATHLHQLSSMERLQKIKNVKNFHLRVTYNKNKDVLIYDRKLENGSGSSIYGLEVCKAMDLDKDFLKLANKIRREIMDINDKILSDKKSKYNNSVYIDKCAICEGKTEDVHHINFQCESNEDGIIDHYHKNHKANLVGLCKKHHDMVHSDKLQINGYKLSTGGMILDYHFIDNPEVIAQTTY